MPVNISTEYTHTLLAGLNKVQRATSFLRDRYFPTNATTDIFNTEKVLIDYKDGNRKVAPFILAGGKEVTRDGFDTVEYNPPRIAPKMPCTIDDLKKRGFGEALESRLTPAERALKMNIEDLQDLDKRITRREELMCAEILLNNKIDMVHQNSETDTGTTTVTLKFYSGETNPQAYTTAAYWDAAGAKIIDDIFAMANELKQKGRNVADLILGNGAVQAFVTNDEVLKLLDTKNYMIGQVAPVELPSGAFQIGVIVAYGIRLNVFSYPETYTDDAGETKSFIPNGAVIVTAPGAGRTLYGCVTQLEPDREYYSYPGRRVPKYLADEANDKRTLTLTAKPVPCPNCSFSWITMSDCLTPAG